MQILDLLQKIVFGVRLRRIEGGTKSLSEKLGKGLKWQNGVCVDDLSEESEGIFLHSKNKSFGPFNNVICAVQANQLKFLPKNYDLEKKNPKNPSPMIREPSGYTMIYASCLKERMTGLHYTIR